MTVETVLSPILDKHMNSNLNSSLVWKSAFKPEEVTEDIRRKHNSWYEYTIKFDGLKPIQCTKYREV